jgi:hypothetical protein
MRHEIRGMKIEKPQPQETIGKYPVMREIGSGATSHVYLAHYSHSQYFR